MKAEFAHTLRCPACLRQGTFGVVDAVSDEREVREGVLHCASCSTEFAMHRGVPELLFEPPEHIVKEAAGLERFAEQMRLEGWNRETVLRLPRLEHGYWYVQA